MNVKLSPRHAITAYGIALLVVALIAGTALFAVRELSHRALDGAERQAGRFIGGAQSALNRAVLGVDVLLAGAGDLVPEPALLQTPAARDRVSQLMEIGVNQNPLVQNMTLVSASGQRLVSSEERGRGNGGGSGLPAGYLDAVLRPTVPTLVIGNPVTSALTYQQVLHLGRALRLSDGTRVAVVAEVDLALLMNLLVQGADINGLEVTLERDSGLLMASVPTFVRSQSPPPARIGGSGLSRGEARLTGAPAIVVVRRSMQTDVLVTGSIPLASALADWRRERNIIFSFALALIWVVAAAAVLAHRRIQRQRRARLELLRSRAQLDQALESMQVGFVLLDSEHRMLVWNRSFLEIFPAAEDLTALHRPFAPILALAAQYRRHPSGGVDTGSALETWLLQTRGANAVAPFEDELYLPDGRVIRSTKNRTPDGGLVCIYQDVTEKKMRTAEILQSRAQLQATLDALPDTLLELDGNGLCHQFHAPQGPGGPIDGHDPMGRAVHDFLPPGAAAAVMDAVREAEVAGASRGRHFELALAGGAGHFEISVSRKALQGAEPTGYIVILRDVTQAELAARHIRQLAFYDVLTGLPNRRYLLDLMASAVRIHPGSGHGAVLFLDLDDFKTLNDALGHAMGDVLLKEAAARIRRHVRPGDVVARLGGDEFVVMLESLGPDVEAARTQAREVGEQILAALNMPFSLDAQTRYQRTCSIGVALFDGRERSLEELLKQADIAMYVAKTSGGNGLRYFEPAMQATVAARSALENEIREALAARAFDLHYQSQVDESGHVVGAEALVRWRHPQRGLVMPGDFIAVAESTELIVPLGLQVLEMACAQLALWAQHPERAALQLAVNVSARQFRRDDFVEQVERVLAASGANPAMLKLELTESLLQSQMEETIRTMHRLKAIGIRFSMDDFGTGYSSLSYLTQLPLDQIKIDKYFVGGIGCDPKIELIVQTIIGMARNLDVELIAEGVETQAQCDFLRANGCFRYQGYLFSRPVSIAEFESALSA